MAIRGNRPPEAIYDFGASVAGDVVQGLEYSTELVVYAQKVDQVGVAHQLEVNFVLPDDTRVALPSVTTDDGSGTGPGEEVFVHAGSLDEVGIEFVDHDVNETWTYPDVDHFQRAPISGSDARGAYTGYRYNLDDAGGNGAPGPMTPDYSGVLALGPSHFWPLDDEGTATETSNSITQFEDISGNNRPLENVDTSTGQGGGAVPVDYQHAQLGLPLAGPLLPAGGRGFHFQVGGAAAWRPAKVQRADEAALRPAAFTFFTFVRMHNLSDTNYSGCVASKTAGSAGWSLMVYEKQLALVWNSAFQAGTYRPATRGAAPFVNNQVYLIAMDYEAGTWRLWVDGQLDHTGTATLTHDTTMPFSLGHYSGYQYTLDADFQRAGIIPRRLTAAEHLALWNTRDDGTAGPGTKDNDFNDVIFDLKQYEITSGWTGDSPELEPYRLNAVEMPEYRIRNGWPVSLPTYDVHGNAGVAMNANGTVTAERPEPTAVTTAASSRWIGAAYDPATYTWASTYGGAANWVSDATYAPTKELISYRLKKKMIKRTAVVFDSDLNQHMWGTINASATNDFTVIMVVNLNSTQNATMDGDAGDDEVAGLLSAQTPASGDPALRICNDLLQVQASPDKNFRNVRPVERFYNLATPIYLAYVVGHPRISVYTATNASNIKRWNLTYGYSAKQQNMALYLGRGADVARSADMMLFDFSLYNSRLGPIEVSKEIAKLARTYGGT